MINPEFINHNVVIVLGMHRSGTSAVAAGLEHSGVALGQSLYPGDEWNPKGYFEDVQLVEFNNQLLAVIDCRWDSPLIPAELPTAWLARIEDAVELLQSTFQGRSQWGFKDPRMCVLAPFWKAVFARMNIRPKLLLVVRDPADVAHSLERRDGIGHERSAWLWMTHFQGALDWLDDQSDAHLVDFNSLVVDPAKTLRAIANWIGLTPEASVVNAFATEFMSATLAHGNRTGSVALPSLVTEAYEQIEASIRAGITPFELRNSIGWKALEQMFASAILPSLKTVSDFYKHDRQLAILDNRIRGLSSGLVNSERLAMERLEQLQALDDQLKRTHDALAFAEQLAFHRHEQLGELDQQLKLTTAGLDRAERLVDQRDQELTNSQRPPLPLATAAVKRKPPERTASERLHSLEHQLEKTTRALESVDALASDRMSELKGLPHVSE